MAAAARRDSPPWELARAPLRSPGSSPARPPASPTVLHSPASPGALRREWGPGARPPWVAELSSPGQAPNAAQNPLSGEAAVKGRVLRKTQRSRTPLNVEN